MSTPLEAEMGAPLSRSTPLLEVSMGTPTELFGVEVEDFDGVGKRKLCRISRRSPRVNPVEELEETQNCEKLSLPSRVMPSIGLSTDLLLS
jgi:hypothetical protein